MQKITRSQLAARDALCQVLAERYEALEDAVFEFNEAIQKYWDKVEVAQTSYNESIADANDWLSEIAGEIEEFIGAHSEKWQESARGQAYQAWYEAFITALEEVDLDQPDALELEEGDQGEILTDLPEEVDLS